jgi:hypothetical protein
MASHVNTTAQRIMAVDWESSYEKTRSRVTLVFEYLRRAAWWAQAVKAQQWPFFDIAAAVSPKVRADAAVVRRVEAALGAKSQGELVVSTCVRALHFAALLDAGAKLPKVPGSAAEPFEPLLVMFERGGGFRMEGGRFIEVDLRGVPMGTKESNLADKPVVELTPAALDALDGG